MTEFKNIFILIFTYSQIKKDTVSVSIMVREQVKEK